MTIRNDKIYLDIPRLSLAERDRRYTRLRELMAVRGIDCLVLPCNTGHWGQFQADVQYVTSMGGNDAEIAALFPREGDPTAWVRSARYIEPWLGAQDWITDIRDCRGIWAPAIVARVRELGLERATIGIVGLAGLIRAVEGIIPYEMMITLKRELPEAIFVNATDLLQEARMIKSAEEITMLERATMIAEGAVTAMIEAAQPGLSDARVYAAVYDAMLRAGGEIPTMVLWRAGADAYGNFYIPTNRLLQAGDVITSEIEGKYAGYRAQVVQPVFVSYARAPYPAMVELSVAAFNKLVALMRPGVMVGELIDACEEIGVRSGFKTQLLLHGRGLGEDPPLYVGYEAGISIDVTRSFRLEEGNVLIVKPEVRQTEHQRSIAWGDTVVITADGARRLGKRPQGLSLTT